MQLWMQSIQYTCQGLEGPWDKALLAIHNVYDIIILFIDLLSSNNSDSFLLIDCLSASKQLPFHRPITCANLFLVHCTKHASWIMIFLYFFFTLQHILILSSFLANIWANSSTLPWITWSHLSNPRCSSQHITLKCRHFTGHCNLFHYSVDKFCG